MKRIKVDVVTAADGSATFYSPKTSGKVHSVHYLKDGVTAFTDGVDFTITTEATAEGIWTESNVNVSTSRYPRAPTSSQAGVASLYAAAGTAIQDKVALGNDRIKVVIAQGGNAKKGEFIFLVD
ncbi:hypothetical protein [Mesorhizobium sp.]|uniref:hypothetical protein n=1 Tax=Mesorhizobium sp. TaxID=1871066 RepID=UPI000FE64A85|nr:hypothetical protein [Mesorhizobium sp.]RWC28816.1 MAG: hypothetical protein EOS27_17905 [Mesorhizobium sp.]TIX28273.1 MAG: hypothetical protein E5V35_02740 [Mesorhizobium sp.]